MGLWSGRLWDTLHGMIWIDLLNIRDPGGNIRDLEGNIRDLITRYLKRSPKVTGVRLDK